MLVMIKPSRHKPQSTLQNEHKREQVLRTTLLLRHSGRHYYIMSFKSATKRLFLRHSNVVLSCSPHLWENMNQESCLKSCELCSQACTFYPQTRPKLQLEETEENHSCKALSSTAMIFIVRLILSPLISSELYVHQINTYTCRIDNFVSRMINVSCVLLGGLCDDELWTRSRTRYCQVVSLNRAGIRHNVKSFR